LAYSVVESAKDEFLIATGGCSQLDRSYFLCWTAIFHALMKSLNKKPEELLSEYRSDPKAKPINPSAHWVLNLLMKTSLVKKIKIKRLKTK